MRIIRQGKRKYYELRFEDGSVLYLPVPPEPVELKRRLKRLLKVDRELLKRILKQSSTIASYLWSGKGGRRHAS